jgi:hypothetical protein
VYFNECKEQKIFQNMNCQKMLRIRVFEKKALPPEETECRGRVVNTPALYSGGPGFKSWPQQPAILIEVVRGFSQSLQANSRILPYN